MKILAIETSCDETAVAIVEGVGDEETAQFHVLGNALLSQVEIHAKFGGVYPNLAKREHAKNLVPLLEAALSEAELLHEDAQVVTDEIRDNIAAILSREPELAKQFFDFALEAEPPAIDAIAITAGPGLEPALWVGVSFAKALALLWDKPLLAINHMEGHVFAAMAQKTGDERFSISGTRFPVLALLISGGHTELVLMKEWLQYERIGETRDDAVGEAFDKVARMLELPYPGGPHLSKLAEEARGKGETNPYKLPRPMFDSGTCDFSFAGLKTAVLYLLKSRSDITVSDKLHIAREFEDAVADVLWKKTSQALSSTGAKTLVIGGGVSANTHIRRTFAEHMKNYPDATLLIPSAALTTDNALMIAFAGYYRALRNAVAEPESLRANGNLSLG